MKTRLMSLCLLIMLLCLNLTPAHALSLSGDYKYNLLMDGTVVIEGYIGKANTLYIPAYIDGKPVSKIGRNAFERCYSLTELTIPTSVTSIAYDAFEDCPSLTLTVYSGSYAQQFCEQRKLPHTVPDSLSWLTD